MILRKVIIAAMLAASLGSIATAANAAPYARMAPPEPRSESVPEPRRNRVWVAGHWQWNGNRYHWVKGKWIQARRGYAYNQPQWAERDGRWQMSRGSWARGDNDGDGVRNSRDRSPNNPNRN